MCVGAPAGAFSEPKIMTLCSFGTENNSAVSKIDKVCIKNKECVWALPQGLFPSPK